MFVRKVKKEDSRRIWEIRNHPISRKNSNSSEEFSFEQHDAWFQDKYFNNKENYCFVLKSDSGQVIGYCRYDIDNSSYVISIAIDPDNHSKGLGGALLKKSLKEMDIEKDILAEIAKSNIPSVKLFKKNSFNIYKEDKKNYYLKYKKVNSI